MNKITLGAILSIVFVASVVPVSAQSLYSYAGSSAACTNLTQDLAFGSRSSQVTQLQRFLVGRNYPGGGSWMVTGYFGAATRAAVRNFQQEMGLSQTGTADATTRQMIYQASCGGSSYLPSYTPSYANNYNTYYPFSYSSYYTTPVNYFSTPCDTNYAYGQFGWYNYSSCNTAVGSDVSIAYITPLSGATGETVTIYGNGFTTRDNTVYFGIGVVSGLNSPDGRSVSFTVPSNLSGYGSQQVTVGTYDVSVKNGNGRRSGAVPFTVTSLNNTARPSISNVSGPTSVAAGTNAVWTIQVSNPGSAYLSVSVNWGDQSAYPYASASAPQTVYLQGMQTLTFSHTYMTAGMYTITFTATNANGLSNASTATVSVSGSGTTGTTPTILYLSPASGQVGTSVTIYGSNFSQWGNTVRFGNGAITNVASNNGTTMTFVVPASLSPYCMPGYYCAQYMQTVTPSIYPVSVVNASGNASNFNIFTVQ